MYKRHDLLWLSTAGREAALRTARPLLAEATDEQVVALVRKMEIPAIVSRQEERREGVMEAGFASPEKYEGSRLRVGVLAALESVERVVTPFQVAERILETGDFPRHSLLRGLVEAGTGCGVAVGFYGSTALEMMTGLGYCDAGSDVDVYARMVEAGADVRGFYDAVLTLEEKSGNRIDVEWEYQGNYGIKLKELFAGQKMVLAKGLYSVELFPTQTVLPTKKATRETGNRP